MHLMDLPETFSLNVNFFYFNMKTRSFKSLIICLLSNLAYKIRSKLFEINTQFKKYVFNKKWSFC